MRKFLKKWQNRFLGYVISDRKRPRQNREHVGQNLMILAIFIFFVFIINFVIIIGTDKKFGEKLSDKARDVYQTTVTVQAKRGTIYDRNGNPIAEDSTTYSVYAIIDKSYISSTGEKLYVQSSQFDQVAEIFNQQLDMDKEEVLSQLRQKNVFQVSFGTKGSGISYSTMSAITEAMQEAGIEGIAFTTSPGRMYKNGIFASQFIGVAQLQENKDGTKSLIGTSGLEASLNDILSGEDGTVTYEKDKNGNTLLGTGTTVKEAVNGKDVYTTLSEPIQTYLETQMDVFQAEAKGVYASATLINAKTGEILATSQRPTYNPSTLEGYDEGNLKTWNTLLYQSNYEPGSTMKVMTLASAIDSGVFNPSESYSNSEGLTIADATIQDWAINEGSSTGQYMTMAQGFAYSSNVGMTMLEQKMGNDKWLNYLSKFRFGYPTRFGMGNEATGLLPSDNIVTIAMSAFGQGIATTQTQMLRAFTSVSNDGVMVEPQFISKLYDPNTDTSRSASAEVVGNPVSAEAARQTRDYMVTVGTDPYYGTLYSNGPIIQVGNESVAVKSGTAQIAAEDGSGYLTGSNDYIYSVVAMLPSEDPEFVMYVTLQQPEERFSALYWQDVVNPVLEEAALMRDTLLAPAANDTDQQTEYLLDDIVGKNPGETAEELRRNLVHPVVLGTGSKISKVSKKSGSNLAENEQLLLLTNHLEKVPDMYGWTKANVDTFAKWTGIKIKYKGSDSGTVVKQSVDIDTNIDDIKKMTITLGE
ncbi:PASTA domain-containing protein [Streptococcus chenjunshii]|uniref:PASTA domain-containing protein n=1 Tax=Streptococcus chenjunshii TaxID=2173853 RepID=A0A372KJ83_9STRE|nr:penicillin-binding protein PBP2X [Streptococcus chenjunshii]AXQ79255.1 PASTA domain-containing protein [Streptococcus chenjunshii]RFU50564.1 PASTA domain-containing protein [Streptococcus chenjunshii]RFU52325.1 PASTA domain-containing protein [Streptococcus chenjunshii]